MNTAFNPGYCKECSHVNQVFCALAQENNINQTEERTAKSYKKGEVVFSEGSYPVGVHVVYKGKIKIVKLGFDGKEQIVRFARKGDLLGYRSLLGNHVYRASGIALSDAIVCHIPEEVFLTTLTKNHWLYIKLLKKVCNELGRAEDIIISIAQKSVKERIAEAIIVLYYKFGLDTDDSIDVNLTRKEIGDFAGTTIESTIRTLSQLKKEGLIQFNNKQIVVPDIIKLVKLSHYSE